MEKKANIILFVCVVSTLTVALLYLLVATSIHKSCELIVLNSTSYRDALLSNWVGKKILRSNDKTVLFKINAHLEYDIEESPVRSTAITSTSTTSFPALPITGLAVSFSTVTPSNPIRLNQPNPTVGSTQPLRLASKLPATLTLKPNGSVSIDSPNSVDPASRPANQLKKLYLPLGFTEIEAKRSGNKHKFKLHFNCSTVFMSFERNNTQLHLSEIDIELKLRSKQKSRCSVDLPRHSRTFSSDIRNGFARFYCDKELRFNCASIDPKHPSRPAVLLAQLVINGIEFELGLDSNRHKGREFVGTRNFCS